MIAYRFGFVPSDALEAGTIQAIFAAPDASSNSLIGPEQIRLLAIAIRTDDGTVTAATRVRREVRRER